jgi:LPXTG-site transpeptidase (sortase) family protein
MPKKSRKRNLQPSFSILALFLIGLLIFTISTLWRIHQSQVLSFQSAEPLLKSNIKTKQPLPTEILIDKYKIKLPVKEAAITSGKWEINPQGASHLSTSASPKDGGNIVIYGHNKPSLFGRALGLKIGDSIKIITTDNKVHTYKVFETKIVSPNEISVLLPTSFEILTFYTCTGLLDTKRFIVRAKVDESTD